MTVLRKELEEQPQATSKRQKAARQWAARERQEQVEKALRRMTELGSEKQKQDKKANQKDRQRQLRASITDAGAHSMKMADCGYRPAYNVQFATDTQTQVIIGVEVSNRGNDKGELGDMMTQIETRYQRCPEDVLVDGAYVQFNDFVQVSQKQITIYAPVLKRRKPDIDPYQPLPGDSPGIASWRQRMATPEAQLIYKERAATAECVNAIQHNRGLQSFRVRGNKKVRSAALWFALLHTLLRGQTLRLATQPI